MTNIRSKNEKQVTYELTRPNGSLFTYTATPSTHFSDSSTKRKGEIFNVGGGSFYRNYDTTGEPWFDYGSHVLKPQNDFLAWVQMWGAGGAGQHRSGDTAAGGGGFTQALVQFKAQIPYTIVVGQGGNFDNVATHGGGGRGHSSGGSGGGLSGLFMGSTHFGKSSWAHTTTPVTQSQALLIAGGGGGKGYHTQSHHGAGGGGGGWDGRSGHNSGGGGQTGGGGGGYNGGQTGQALHGGHSGSNTSWLGGGGGGWYGGGGGGHTSNHHNGGGGGSGHYAYPSNIATQANNDKAQYIITGHTLRAPGDHGTQTPMPANDRNPLAQGDGGVAGNGGRGSEVGQSDKEGQKHGKVVITLAHEIMNKSEYVFPTHTAPGDNNAWSQSY